VPRRTPVYHETIHIPKKSYVNFMVLTDDLSKLLEHYAWLGTEDEYLYAIVPIPLVNPMAKAGLRLRTDITRQRKYGVIKITCYWTKAVTEEASYSFTIQHTRLFLSLD